MTVQEYRAFLEKILSRNLFLRKQINALSIMSIQYTIGKSPIGEEYKCTYDLPDLWREYALKLKRCVYFLENYCSELRKELDFQNDLLQSDNISVSPTTHLEEAIFNFDALVLSTSAIIDSEEKDYLVKQFKKARINNIYPNKEEIGLHWQLNILRNRIVHHTGGRFMNTKECQRFLEFSSMASMIRVVHGNLSLSCTQIDVCKEAVKEVLPAAIHTGKNVFDILFPSKSGKGHGKTHPIMIMPNKDIYFDHADAGVNMVSKIQDFICKLDQAFFEEFCWKSMQEEYFSNLCVEFSYNEYFCQYQAKDVFECNVNE